MTAVSVEHVSYRGDKEAVQAVILSDNVPATLPTTGADIKGMNANQVFAPLMSAPVVGEADHKVFITNESGVFVPQ